ncbi:MAG TPA: hypothetical protein VES97_10955 [Solirubrobacteraceae bacterium]|nr:hypothetical protein [Solirubrobacteraceae bacterium]
MKRNLKRHAMIAVAVVVLLAGVIAAVSTATGYRHGHSHSAAARLGHRGGQGDSAAAAGYLGLTKAQLRSDLRSGETLAQVADARSGKSASGLLDALVNARTARLAAAGALSQARLVNVRRQAIAKINRAPGPGLGPGGSRSGGLSAAASYLGVSVARLHGDLRSGRTLAQVADAAAGRSATGLIDALVSARTRKLAAEVGAGALTRERERKILGALPRHVTNEVRRSSPKGP